MSLLAAFLPLSLVAQVSLPQPLEGDTGIYLQCLPTGEKILNWSGRADRTYFLQTSPDLLDWSWSANIELGHNGPMSQAVEGPVKAGFFRLIYTDQVPAEGETVETADYDGDGLSNRLELTPRPRPGGVQGVIGLKPDIQTNPLKADTDGDGLSDQWELDHNLDPTDDGSRDPNNGSQGDSDHDGLNNVQEQTAGSHPGMADTDGDGISDGSEVEQGHDPNDANDKPEADWFVIVGDKGQGELKSETREYVVKKGQSRVVVVGTQSDEFPVWTDEGGSEYNDVVEWQITPSAGAAITGGIHVNDRHEDWLADELNGTTLHGVSVAHVETVKVIQAPANADVTVTVVLKATNVSDGALPSRVVVGLLPVSIEAAKISHNTVTGKLDDSKKESIGAFVPTNSDDDDYTATLTNSGSDKDQVGVVTGENDLLPLYLRRIPELTGARFLLNIPSCVRVWKSPSRQDEVLSTTELDASVDTTVYVEGIRKGSDFLKLTLRAEGQERPDVVRLKITVFDLKGVLNVPGHAAYHYTVDGSLLPESQWETPTGGSIKSDSTATQATILWDQGPVVGKAVYTVNSDYVWDLEVNVVQVKLATGTSNKITYFGSPYQNPQIQSQIISSIGFTMTAKLTVEKITGPSVFGSTRGEQFLEVGFIQNGKFTRTHALYDGFTPKKRKRSTLEDGLYHLDFSTEPPGSTSPWYDTISATGRKGFLQIPSGGVTNTNFDISDSPQITATDSMMLTSNELSDMADKLSIVLEFNIYFGIRTVQDINNSKNVYTQCAKASWKFDGSGDININGEWTLTGTGVTGAAFFSEVTNGDVVPVTTDPPINTLLKSRSFVTENQ